MSPVGVLLTIIVCTFLVQCQTTFAFVLPNSALTTSTTAPKGTSSSRPISSMLYMGTNSNNGKESNNDNNSKGSNKKNVNKKSNNNSKKKPNKKQNQQPQPQPQPQQQQQQQQQQGKKKKRKNNLINLFNPYQAGAKFRQTLDTALSNTLPKPLTPEQRTIYYLDDRFLEEKNNNLFLPSEKAMAFAQRNTLHEYTDAFNYLNSKYDNSDYVPEILVIGATGSIGRLVVKRLLLLSNKVKVRVLVRDLYSKTLNMLGTGVTYCQGDLNNIESLEYALTDVDKILFCAGAPRPDENDYKDNFRQFVEDTLDDNDKENKEDANDDDSEGGGDANGDDDSNKKTSIEDLDFQQLSDVMEMRAMLAEQVDGIGMQNVIRAYQNVRHADYGTSQAAKRSLFKFQSREKDFDLFSIHIDDDYDDYDQDDKTDYGNEYGNDYGNDYGNAHGNAYDNDYDSDYNEESDYYENNYDTANGKDSKRTKRLPSSTSMMTAQVNWIKNKFKHGVFTGRFPNVPSISSSAKGSEASIISSRLRSRDDDSKGIDFSNGFAGLLCRICSDGKTYEAFLRTSEYETDGIEYVCKFKTASKILQSGAANKSINKFATVRLPFSKFVPMIRNKRMYNKMKNNDKTQKERLNTRFEGNDVKQIGFRINNDDNIEASNDKPSSKASTSSKKNRKKNWISFYLALSYIKVYRSQPEPEFIYLSDARLGGIHSGMIRHDLKQIVLSEDENDDIGISTTIFDEKEAKRVMTNKNDRSSQELYYKYCGEEMLKGSGLSYSIVRIPELNELKSGEFSTLELKQTSDNLEAVSRSEVAAVCVSALLDPNARNICFSISKSKRDKAINIDETISNQFLRIHPET